MKYEINNDKYLVIQLPDHFGPYPNTGTLLSIQYLPLSRSLILLFIASPRMQTSWKFSLSVLYSTSIITLSLSEKSRAILFYEVNTISDWDKLDRTLFLFLFFKAISLAIRLLLSMLSGIYSFGLFCFSTSLSTIFCLLYLSIFIVIYKPFKEPTDD